MSFFQHRRNEHVIKDAKLDVKPGLRQPSPSMTDNGVYAVEDKAHALYQLLEGQASIARQSVSGFFSFVMRDEDTLRPILVAPHQQVILDFAMAHDRSVIMVPADHAKTFSMAALMLYELARDHTLRGAFVSATAGQASKPLDMVRSYIESNLFLKTAFPSLKPSTRQGDPWTTSSMTIERPRGIRDPSLRAVGIDGNITGARLNRLVVDDILDRLNTATQAQRKKVYDYFDSTLMARMVPKHSRVTVTNTAWHPEDLPHQLEQIGWPTLRMAIDGNIIIRNTDWDSELIRPATPNGEECRLVAYDPDPYNATTLWPTRYDREGVEKLRREHLPYRFNQLYMQNCRDDQTARCKQEWIDKCKRQGMGLSLVSRYDGPNLTFTGIDLAVQPGEENDDVAFFTFEQLPDGRRRILDIDVGQFDGPTIVDKMFQKAEAYNSIMRVENNACFPPGTPVLTKRGTIPIEQVRWGDEVWTHKHRWREVTVTHEGTSRTLVSIKTNFMKPFRVTPNHWFLGRTSFNVDPEWVSVGFVNKDCFLATYSPEYGTVWKVFENARTLAIEPYNGPVFNLTVDEDESYIAGGYVVHNAQDFIRQFALHRNASLPLKAHTTGRGKAHPEHGVEGLFVELSNGAWIIPCDQTFRCHPNVQRWIDECLYYTPSSHTGDVLMANYFSREQARAFGCNTSGSQRLRDAFAGSLSMQITSRLPIHVNPGLRPKEPDHEQNRQTRCPQPDIR